MEEHRELLRPIYYDNALSAFDMSLNGSDTSGIITLVTLLDFDKFNYRVEFWLPTKEQGLLYINTYYSGEVRSAASLVQWVNGEFFRYTFDYNSEYFKKFMDGYLRKQREQFKSSAVREDTSKFEESLASINRSSLSVDLYNAMLSTMDNCLLSYSVSDEDQNMCLWHYNET